MEGRHSFSAGLRSHGDMPFFLKAVVMKPATFEKKRSFVFGVACKERANRSNPDRSERSVRQYQQEEFRGVSTRTISDSVPLMISVTLWGCQAPVNPSLVPMNLTKPFLCRRSHSRSSIVKPLGTGSSYVSSEPDSKSL